VVKASAKIVINLFHNLYYAFALLMLRYARSMRVPAHQILVANATVHRIVKIDPEMSTTREHPEPKVDAQGCRTVNCCGAFLTVFRLAITGNGACLPD
jgi:hypothetical protein